MTASKQEFDSAAMLLERVWFAAEHIDRDKREIDWEGIKEVQDSIAPSSSELVKVAAAKSLWTSRPVTDGSYIDALHHLDTENMELFLRAIRVRAGLA